MAILFAVAPAIGERFIAAAEVSSPPPPAPASGSPTPAEPAEEQRAPTPPPFDPDAPLEPVDRDTLLRLAWRTLAGHLTDNPIRTADLDPFDLTPALLAPHGCFITLLTGGQTRGLQGEVDATRPLYQQVIIWTRRAATRDARFLPLTDLDLAETTLRIEIISRREPVSGPGGISIGRHGILLEKWGRRALFLPGLMEEQKWTPSRALDELCKQAALPTGAWSQGARLEVFTTQVIEGTQPPPPPPAEVPPVEPRPASKGNVDGAPGEQSGNGGQDAGADAGPERE